MFTAHVLFTVAFRGMRAARRSRILSGSEPFVATSPSLFGLTNPGAPHITGASPWAAPQ